jgi:hypothetical protein
MTLANNALVKIIKFLFDIYIDFEWLLACVMAFIVIFNDLN